MCAHEALNLVQAMTRERVSVTWRRLEHEVSNLRSGSRKAPIFRFFTTAAVLVGVTGFAPPPAPLQPTGKWIVDFADAQCLAARDYATAEGPIKLVLKQPPLGSVVQVAVLTDKRGDPHPEQREGSVAFDERPPTKLTSVEFRPKGATMFVRSMMVPRTVFASARTAKTLRFRSGRFDRLLALGDMADLLKVMETCVDDLRRVWNVDPAATDQPLQGPLRNGLRGIFEPDDYPADAINRLQQGTVRIALLVDEQGRIADCSVLESSDVAILDAQTCAILRLRAKFEPDRDTAGRPRKSAFIQRIAWRME